MNTSQQPPRKTEKKGLADVREEKMREGGDDSLANAAPDDIHADEKVIVNEQREEKIVNAPSQTGAITNDGDTV